MSSCWAQPSTQYQNACAALSSVLAVFWSRSRCSLYLSKISTHRHCYRILSWTLLVLLFWHLLYESCRLLACLLQHTHTLTLSIQSPPGPCSCPPMAAFLHRLHGLTVTLATSQNTTALPVLLALFSHLLEGLAELSPTHMHFLIMWSYLCMLVAKIKAFNYKSLSKASPLMCSYCFIM